MEGVGGTSAATRCAVAGLDPRFWGLGVAGVEGGGAVVSWGGVAGVDAGAWIWGVAGMEGKRGAIGWARAGLDARGMGSRSCGVDGMDCCWCDVLDEAAAEFGEPEAAGAMMFGGGGTSDRRGVWENTEACANVTLAAAR